MFIPISAKNAPQSIVENVLRLLVQDVVQKYMSIYTCCLQKRPTTVPVGSFKKAHIAKSGIIALVLPPVGVYNGAMPRSIKRPCSYPGCSTLVERGRCNAHPYPPTAQRYARDRRRADLYNTAAWARMRIRQLANSPWCADCLRSGIHTPATDVDHIMPHRGDTDLFYRGALQSLCHACHSAKTARENYESRVGEGYQNV